MLNCAPYRARDSVVDAATMAAFVMSMSARFSAAKVGGASLGFKASQAVSAVRIPMRAKGVASAVGGTATLIVCGKTKNAVGGGNSRGGKIAADGGGKQKTKKSAAKRQGLTLVYFLSST